MAASSNDVILVTGADVPVGTAGKLDAHREGWLHRAFSVLLFHPESDHLLLHQRAEGKYHAPGMWTNTCCSHPAPGEATLDAANRRLMEEMGMAADLHEVFSLTYRLEMANGLIEHEFDHVFAGRATGEPRPNPDEVADWQWLTPAEVSAELEHAPERYTPWFRLIWPKWLKVGASPDLYTTA